MSEQHTGQPAPGVLVADGLDLLDESGNIVATTGNEVDLTQSQFDLAQEIARRWNACAGLADPLALREECERLRAAIESIAAYRMRSPKERHAMDARDMCQKAIDALAVGGAR